MRNSRKKIERRVLKGKVEKRSWHSMTWQKKKNCLRKKLREFNQGKIDREAYIREKRV